MAKSDPKAQAAAEAAKVLPTLNFLLGESHHPSEEYVASIFEKCYRAHPFKGANKRQVAYHEGGHLVAYEVGGMLADSAFIARGIDSWFGGASNRKHMLRDSAVLIPEKYSLEDLRTEATSLVAGPLAEALFARGDLLSSVGEVFLFQLLTREAATILGQDWERLLAETVAQTSAILLTYEKELKKVSTVLMRCGVVDRGMLCKIFERVLRTPPHPYAVQRRRAEMPILGEREQLVTRPRPYKPDDRLSPGTRRT